MIFSYFLNFNNEFSVLNENFDLQQNVFSIFDYSTFFFYNLFLNFNFIFLEEVPSLHTNVIIDFINQTEDIFLFNNLENIKTIYHYSIPNTKLAYPEPFIASASMMHSDLWFVHILIYQYWLWFVFVFLIIFFFITFICTVRWCNMRVKPRRETRGVSRSKCGDLITATVPVSWATSIIVHESTDAIDYYDGFGTSELVVGIRAYQWGWEYYYPKDIDLNYNIKHNYSSFIGNSLKYGSTTDLNLRTNNMWKYYQNKNFDSIITPAHLLLFPLDNYKILNFINFNDVGLNLLNETNAFKKIKMFSKTSQSFNLVSLPYDFNNKYKQFSYYFKNDNKYAESLNLGFKRQHNFLTFSAINNGYSTFFDSNSTKKWINCNFPSLENLSNNNFSFRSLNYLQNFFLTSSSLNSLRISTLFNFYEQKLKTLTKFLYFSNVNQLFNNDDDKKKFAQSILKLNNLLKKKSNFSNLENFTQINSTHDLLNLFDRDNNELVTNKSKFYKLFSSFSSNQTILTNAKSFRNFVNIIPTFSTFNHNAQITSLASHVSNADKSLSVNNFFFYNLNFSQWPDLSLLNKLSSNRIYFDSPYNPIISNNPYLNTLSFDSYRYTFIENTPSTLQGKEDQLPNFLITAYWNFYWANSDVEWRLKNNFNYKNLHDSFYLPLFSFYYDYDFRNWQSLELFEDVLWESVYSIYTFDEYLSLNKDFYNCQSVNKYFNWYFAQNKKFKFSESILKISNEKDHQYSNFFYTDDQLSPTHLVNTSFFFIFPIINNLQIIDETYESLKFLNYITNISYKTFFFSIFSNFLPVSHFTLFDFFRSDYGEFSWFFDDKNFFKKYSIFDQVDSPVYFNFASVEHTSHLNFNKQELSLFEKTNDLTFHKIFRFNDVLSLRSPVKNSIVTYNALQKVFRSRFDEGRSNAKIFDYSNTTCGQPYISEPRLKYEKLLNKNRENFFDVNFFKNNFFTIFNEFYDAMSSLNFYTFEFPFLLAMKSDASRYLWFDWFAKWGFYEVQPSSSSRYAIYGMPYFNKNFEFNTQIGENFTEAETYLLRIAKARRNYLPNWTYSPYLFLKSNNWYKNNIIFSLLMGNSTNLNNTEWALNKMSWYWNNTFFISPNPYLTSLSSSNLNSFAKSFWKPQSSVQSYYYSISVLVDILTKREYLYREYLNANNKIVSLPLFLVNSPNNPLINELKAAFFFLDPSSISNEYSRDVYFNSLNFFNFNILKSIFEELNDSLNLAIVKNYLFFYFFNATNVSSFKSNQELYQNQYRPMRKGITNMIRLHATGAVAMPVEVKLQILASSKDVIHSWAIPSAGIKIDCVPGYSSHKVSIFLVSGIFWGQCMEICGRYHHWMPIVIYFMKRDLFFLWCTHFVFLSGANNMWTINDRQYTDYVRIASFDKLSWLSEINNF